MRRNTSLVLRCLYVSLCFGITHNRVYSRRASDNIVCSLTTLQHNLMHRLMHDIGETLMIVRDCGGTIEVDELSRPVPQLPQMHSALSRPIRALRSEEHTSQLQSRQYLVCRLLLEKKNKMTPT